MFEAFHQISGTMFISQCSHLQFSSLLYMCHALFSCCIYTYALRPSPSSLRKLNCGLYVWRRVGNIDFFFQQQCHWYFLVTTTQSSRSVSCCCQLQPFLRFSSSPPALKLRLFSTVQRRFKASASSCLTTHITET